MNLPECIFDKLLLIFCVFGFCLRQIYDSSFTRIFLFPINKNIRSSNNNPSLLPNLLKYDDLYILCDAIKEFFSGQKITTYLFHLPLLFALEHLSSLFSTRLVKLELLPFLEQIKHYRLKEIFQSNLLGHFHYFLQWLGSLMTSSQIDLYQIKHLDLY